MNNRLRWTVGDDKWFSEDEIPRKRAHLQKYTRDDTWMLDNQWGLKGTSLLWKIRHEKSHIIKK